MLQVLHEIGGPDLIRRAEDQDLDLVVRQDDAVISVASVTLTLRDEAGEVVVDAGIGTFATPGRVRYALDAADVPSTRPYALGWRGVWTITDTDGVVHRVARDYALVRYTSTCPVVSQDLYDLHPTLRTELPEGALSFSAQIKQAWVWFTEQLFQKGRRHWLVVTTGSPRECVLYKALAIVFSDARGENARYAALAAHYEQAAADALARMTFEYRTDEESDIVGEDRSASPVLFLGAGPSPARLVVG